MSYFGKKWKTNPTWGDFVVLVGVWGYLFIPLVICFRKIWWVVLLAILLYSIIIYFTYRHVQVHKTKKKK